MRKSIVYLAISNGNQPIQDAIHMYAYITGTGVAYAPTSCVALGANVTLG